jgi:hypothetical protein
VSEFDLGQKDVVQEAEVEAEARLAKEVDFHDIGEVVEVEVEVKLEIDIVLE